MAKSTAKVLLVEDDPTLIDMYSLKFKEEGYNLLVADNGEDGLALALKEIPNVILLDIMMPRMDGFAVLAELKKNDSTKDIPVVMLSNLGQASDIQKGQTMGAKDYIVKASMTPTQVVAKAKSFIK